jgi:hydroxymethylpyrimidine pyrophosphatase-like HAD family hydrolase
LIFVSDLDQTLIYSEKFIEEVVKDRVMPVEMKDEKIISYILQDTLENLKKMMDRTIFIPATTRTMEQYNRISIFRELTPLYAVVNHGGSILVNGKPDQTWQRCVRDSLCTQCESIKKVREVFDNDIYDSSWVLDIREVEDLFFYCIVENDRIPNKDLEGYMDYMEDSNWQTCLHGRKLYFIPRAVNKWNAVEYIKNMHPGHSIAASGDSIMDLELLEMADYQIMPAHGEAYDALKNRIRGIKTQSTGFKASYEILTAVERLINTGEWRI